MIWFLITLSYLTSSTINADANLRLAFSSFSNLTNQFLYTIQPNDGLNLSLKFVPQILGKSPVSNDTMSYVNYLWQTYVGYCILLIIGVVFVIVFTLVGLCYCCCRCCCNRCGAKPPGPSRSNTKRKRIVLNMLLLIFSSMILVGSIVAMSSNVILLDAIKNDNTTIDQNGNFFSNVNTVIQGIITFINYIYNNAETTGYVSLQKTIANMSTILSSNVALFINTFLNQLNYNLILNATDSFINAFNQQNAIVTLLSNTSATHENASVDFNKYLQSVVKNLTDILAQPPCQNYSSNCNTVSQLLQMITIGYNTSNINYTFDKNTTVVMATFNISQMVSAKVTFVANAQNVTSQINSTVNGYVTDFNQYLYSNSTIFSTYNNTFALKDSLIASLVNMKNNLYSIKLDNSRSINDNVIYFYYLYIFYGLVAIIGITLLIILLFYVGLCFGICGGPNFEDAPCCSKGAGSGYLMAGVAFSFLFGWIIMIIVMAMFLGGGIAQTEGCSYFTGNYSSKPLSTIDNIINASLTTLNFSFPINGVPIGIPKINYAQSLVINCPTSTDLLSAFQIPTSYITQLSNLLYQQFIQSSLVALVQRIKAYKVPAIDTGALSNASTQALFTIIALNDPSAPQTLAELQKNVITIDDVNAFINNVDTLIQISNSSYPDFSKALSATISQLKAKVDSMTTLQTAYKTQKLNFISGFRNLVLLLDKLINLIDSLPSRVSDAVATAVATTNSSLGQNASSLVNQTIFNVLNSFGNCQSLSTVVKVAINAICTTIIAPFNNIWMGIGWFLLFIIPAVITALKLTRLYKISHIETNTSQHSKAYQRTNLFLSEMDMQKIRSHKYESHA